MRILSMAIDKADQIIIKHLLVPPSAGLLYFAGHGYENYGNSFMVPIDAPSTYTSEHCLCVQKILTRMQQKKTGLNVFLLDMCRKRFQCLFKKMYQIVCLFYHVEIRPSAACILHMYVSCLQKPI